MRSTEENIFSAIHTSGILFMTFLFLLPGASANGGCMKVVDNILVQLSMAPLTPLVGEQTSFVVSFASMKMELITREIRGNISIVKNSNRVVVKDFATSEGVIDSKHTFGEPGVYELFVEFSLDGKNYMPEDFLIEVTEADTISNLFTNALILIVGILLGAGFVGLVRGKKKPV